MYETYYNLKAMPFQITTDPKFLWLGEKHSEALAALKYGILENKGFLLLTGDVGTGKTALINRLVKMIDVAAIVAKIPDPGLSSLEFFNFLAIEFKMNKKFESKGEFLIHLKHFLNKAHYERKKVLLIIDEAQRLTHDLLEQIRLLSNIELQDKKLINIFFVGQTEFNEMLMEDRNRAVRQRITVSYYIDPLTEAEARLYIQHRLKVAGATREIFGRDAIREIYNFSGGYPRLINIICDHALLTGYSYDLKLIDKKVITECEQELQIPVGVDFKGAKGAKDKLARLNPPPAAVTPKAAITKKAGIIAAIVMLLVFGIYFLFDSKISDTPRWSMDDIAPQDYQGPAPEELKALESNKVKANETRTENPAEEAPMDKETMDRQKKKETPTIVKTPAEVEDEPKKELSQQQEAAAPLERKILIYFQHNSNELPVESYQTLNRIADFLLRSNSAGISIKGYTDSTGDYSYNVSVSRFRANTIKTYLVGKGVDPATIKADGLGPENPIATNNTAEGRRQNRRVEIELSVDESDTKTKALF
jgi:general secretion pathway protein A